MSRRDGCVEWTSGLPQHQRQKLFLCVSQQQEMFDKQMVVFNTIHGSWDNSVVSALLFPIIVKKPWSVHKKTPQNQPWFSFNSCRGWWDFIQISIFSVFWSVLKLLNTNLLHDCAIHCPPGAFILAEAFDHRRSGRTRQYVHLSRLGKWREHSTQPKHSSSPRQRPVKTWHQMFLLKPGSLNYCFNEELFFFAVLFIRCNEENSAHCFDLIQCNALCVLFWSF